MPDHGVIDGSRSASGSSRKATESDKCLCGSRPGTLRSGWEFDLVFRTGLRVQGELVRLLFLKRPGEGIRFGCAVGKRQGKAHVRVRGRRILREAFRHVAPWIVPDVTFVLSLKDKGLDVKATDICEDLVRILKRRNLLQDSFHGVDWNVPIGFGPEFKAKAEAIKLEQIEP